MSKSLRKQAKKVPARKAPAARPKAAARHATAPAKVKAKTKAKVARPAQAAKAAPRTKTTKAAPARHAHKPAATPARTAHKPAAHVAKHAPAKHPSAKAAPVKAAAPHKAAPGKAHAAPEAKAAAPAPGKPLSKPLKKSGKAAKGGNEKFDIALPASTPEDRQSQLKLLIARGKEQGFLTYAEVNDHLPSEIVDPEQIEDIVQMINDMGIPVYEKAPDAEALLLREPVVADEEAAEEAAAALATTVDAEFGRTTDPVRMYMREMGTVELLTREGEISIAKRIEEGLDAVRRALSAYPPTYDLMIATYEPVKAGQGRLIDIITGFVDPNAPDVIAEPINPKLAAAAKLAAAEDESEDEEEAAEDEEAVETGPDPEEAARRFASLGKVYAQVVKALAEK
ncbi:MAG: RNA polymerase sigma factor region1.1 domain-containing protein, partial [Steroidobacteraceae bacterium]